jgi:hypothetical protein
MAESTFGIQAIAIKPVPTISRIKPRSITMSVLTLVPLFACQWRSKKVHTIGILFQGFILGRFSRRRLRIELLLLGLGLGLWLSTTTKHDAGSGSGLENP